MDYTPYYETMRRTSLLRGMTDAELDTLMACFAPRVRRYAKGELLLMAGYETHEVGLVLEGAITASKPLADGSTVVMARMGPGGVFADVLAGGRSRSPVNVSAAEACLALYLPCEALLRPCAALHSAHLKLLQNWLETISDKYFALDRRLELICCRSLRGRICMWLLEQRERCGADTFSTAMTRTELAAFLNCDRSALSRELSRMQEEGLIELFRGSFKLPDPELSDAAFVGTLTEQKAALDALISGYSAGAVLRHGVDCVLLGRPNVGKSTLLNLLAGFDRAIVTPVAGTTRDIVEQAVQLGSVRLNLFDTAGVREVGADGDAIEAEGIRRSWRKLDEAGLVLAVFDAAQPLSDDDLELARRCQGRPAIAVLNKQDLAGETDVPRGTLEPYFKKIVPMCARDAVGLQALTDAVADLLGTAQLDPEAAQLCSARQLAAATRARDALAEAIAARQNGFGLDAAAVCLTDALQALFDLTGENASDATIEEVFETFCVGK